MKFNQPFKFYLFIFFVPLLFNSCATYKTQIKEGFVNINLNDKKIQHSFYLMGNVGSSSSSSSLGTSSATLTAFENELAKASKNSTAIFLGNNAYPDGLPKMGDENRATAEDQLKLQTSVVKNFKGKTIFIPGNNDWNSGLKGLERQEVYIEKILGENTFLPKRGCPIEKVDIDSQTVLIVIDSEWYLTDWNKHPTINDDCEIRTRTIFFEELESLIKKAIGKTTLIAMHHPMFSNGLHGGQYSFGSHMKPIPVIGTLKNVIRKTSGVSPEDLQNKLYNELIKRVVTLAQFNEKVIFTAGHEHSLQYLLKDNIPQIISGSGSKTTATRNVSAKFTSSDHGFARLDVLKDGSSIVSFYSTEKKTFIYQTKVLPSDKKSKNLITENNFPPTVKASIYTDDEIAKSNFHKFIWGQRYRKYYGTKVTVPTVDLDTLFGGLTPVRKGGGHQSVSLRLENKQGKQYVMRAMRKSAEVYLQAMAFKDQYVIGDFEDTFTESLIQDFYTGSHPYAPFVTGVLSDAVDLFHTNPVLYYVPKQMRLGSFNNEFGNELYMIEEQVSNGHENLESFGFTNKIESTDDLLKKLRKDEKYVIDDTTYLRARLFDMVIGDWDRHTDQWRWAEFEDETTGKKIFKPIPRDRDQAFSIMSDGFLMNIATRVTPTMKLIEGFKNDIRNVKGFNMSPYPLDMILINRSSREQWLAQANFIQKNLTPEVIDKAFESFPKEVQDETITKMKNILLSRIKNLKESALAYYKVINKYAVIVGTDKDDWFDVERKLNGETEVTIYRIKKGEKADLVHQKTYNGKVTEEIWIYGLDDDDVFKIYGKGDKLIKVRVVGGQNNDIYNIENGSKVKIYDYKSKKNTFKTKKGQRKLTDDYITNVYDYKKLKNNINQIIPTFGMNPDDGFKIGVSNIFTAYGFERNPFTSQHTISASYFFATTGFDLNYYGEFANVIGNWNLGLEASFTSPNYSINFFDFGNETINPNNENEDNFDIDYNRVKLSTLKFNPSLIWKGRFGDQFKAGISYESIEVEETQGRFINGFYNQMTFDNSNNFFGIDAIYSFKNQDNKAFPTLGMSTSLQVGYKANIDKSNGLGYIIPTLGINYKIISSGQLVLATKLKGHLNIGNDFEFYNAANLGANDGLRGYRNQRFTGKNAFYQSTDIRLNLRKIRTGLLPLNIGIYGGVDYGRVWLKNEVSKKWHNSFGGGIFANAADIMTFKLSYFMADEGARIAFGMGFGF